MTRLAALAVALLATTAQAEGAFNYCELEPIRADFFGAINEILAFHQDPYRVASLTDGQVIEWDKGELRFECFYRVTYTTGDAYWVTATINRTGYRIVPIGAAD